jgi:hypothetical protein
MMFLAGGLVHEAEDGYYETHHFRVLDKVHLLLRQGNVVLGLVVVASGVSTIVVSR